MVNVTNDLHSVGVLPCQFETYWTKTLEITDLLKSVYTKFQRFSLIYSWVL